MRCSSGGSIQCCALPYPVPPLLSCVTVAPFESLRTFALQRPEREAIMQPILSFCTLLFLSASFASRAWCQLVQDSWTAPASPDGLTSLQSGNPFSIVWKPSLHGQFQGYCHSCDIQRFDLWVASWNNANYNYKFAGKFRNPGFKVTATDLHFR